MTEFVDECRREWRRLRVPEQLANEMAADLAADLREAETDGASPEELLGSAAFDPRGFAESWARERGLVPPGLNDRLRSRTAAVIAAVVVVASLAAAVALLADSPTDSHPPTALAPATTVINRDRVAVPDVIGLQRGEAIGSAGAAGLKVAIRYRVQKGPSTLDVVAQSPPAGVTVRRGTTLLLVVRR
jgi:hypothetical protein